VGALCEELYKQHYETARQQAIENASPAAQKEYLKVNQIPINEREQWLQSIEAEYHKDDFIFALQTDQKLTDEDDPQRVLTINIKRPYGVVPEIIASVSRERDLKERYVKTCWKEFKELKNRIEQKK
jgi:hypothetical protein